MLTTWTPAHMPEKEEIKERLQTCLLYTSDAADE